MQVLSPNSAILEKTRELCSLILQSGEYKDNHAHIEAFFQNDEAQAAYRAFAALGEELHQKQHAGTLSKEDVEAYEKKHAALKDDPVTGSFIGAEEEFNGMVQQIAKMVGKTLELGRVPEAADLQDDGCCGNSGCGCH